MNTFVRWCLVLSAAVCGINLDLARADSTAAWQFKGPFGVAVNSKDVVYVAEINNKRISKFTAVGNWIGTIDEVPGYGKLVGPFDVTVGPRDWLYITDTFNHKVLVLDADEKLQFVLGSDTKSAADGSFAEPHFVAVNQRGEIFVSDTFNARVQKFSPDGKFVKAWGRIGDRPGEFLLMGYLGGIACDDKGFVYVRETDGGRIQKYTEDGEYVATIAKRGTRPGELDEGYGTVVIGDSLWVADTFENRIQVFSLDGKLRRYQAPGEGDGFNQLNHPVGIAATRAGDLIVTDWKNDRVKKLNPEHGTLAVWGRAADDLLAYEPPSRVVRAAGHRVTFSVYGSVSDRDLEAYHRAGVDAVYPSFSNRDGEWGIAASVAKAKELGIQVHPSIAMQVFGQDSMTFINEHPELCIWKKDARAPLGSMLSWAQPEARRYRADHVVDQVRKSGVHGVMLDYIRYLGTDYGYDPIAVDGFFKLYGVNPNSLPHDDPRWMQYRADFVTDFIIELRRKLVGLDREVHLSVYGTGAGTAEASMTASMQDWKTWVRMGIVDTVQIAHYTRDFDRIYTAVNYARELVPARTRVNCFIACYGGNLNSPALLRKGVDVAVAAGADEVTIYRSDAIWELNLWDALAAAIRETNEDR